MWTLYVHSGKIIIMSSLFITMFAIFNFFFFVIFTTIFGFFIYKAVEIYFYLTVLIYGNQSVWNESDSIFLFIYTIPFSFFRYTL